MNNIMTVVSPGVFSSQHVACEDAGRAAYSQLCNWRVQSPASWNQLLKPQNVAHRPVYMQQVSLILAHVLIKVRNFVLEASKT